MFAAGALARRIETAEAALTLAVGSGVGASHPERSILVARIGGGAEPSHESFAREAIRAVLRDMIAVPGFLAYLARRGDTVAGGASLRVHEGIAQLAGAATLPAHRRRGVQTALPRRRLLFAAQAGCDLAVVTTQPGSVSQANVRREGFSLLNSRAILLKTPPRT
ncbi:MAG: GNAT family N-acetyltransferase [Myxococcales bacterium]